MIISLALRCSLLKNINSTFYLCNKVSRTYGSINKPTNSFSKKSEISNDPKILNSQSDSHIQPLLSNPSHHKQTQVEENYKQDSNFPIIQEKTKKIKQKKTRPQVEIFFSSNESNKLDIISEYKEKQMVMELGIIARQMSVRNQKSQIVWCALEQAFVSFLKPTQNPDQIRKLSKILYSLGKSKKATKNYETHMALLLPHSSHQSFTQIVVTISRMGGMSQQFSHIVQKLYWKRKEEFNPLQLGLLNYVLAKNGRKIDPNLIDNLNSLSLRSIALMLRAYDKSGLINQQILNKCIPAILSRKLQTNPFDFRHLFSLYMKHRHLDNPLLVQYFSETFSILKHLIFQDAMQQLWYYMPQSINDNKLPIEFVEKIIYHLRKMRVTNRFSDKAWKKIQFTFNKIQNLEIRVKLQKIY